MTAAVVCDGVELILDDVGILGAADMAQRPPGMFTMLAADARGCRRTEELASSPAQKQAQRAYPLSRAACRPPVQSHCQARIVTAARGQDSRLTTGTKACPLRALTRKCSRYPCKRSVGPGGFQRDESYKLRASRAQKQTRVFKPYAQRPQEPRSRATSASCMSVYSTARARPAPPEPRAQAPA